MEKEKVPYIQQRVLVLTVGTGSEKQLEKTLIKPILKSIDDGEWDTIILLPSHKTLPNLVITSHYVANNKLNQIEP